MKYIYFIFLISIHSFVNTQQSLQQCSGIAIACQFKMNQWAEYNLLPQLRNFNVMLHEKLRNLPNLHQRMSDVKFQEEIHLNAERIIQELTSPTEYLEAFKVIMSDPERKIKVEEVLNQIQEIINGYNRIGQTGIKNLEPLNNALEKNQPLLKKAQEELEKSQKANFNLLAPAIPPACNRLLIPPVILCAGTAANMPNTIWFDLNSATHTKQSGQRQTAEDEAAQLKLKIDVPSAKEFSQATQAPSAKSFDAATNIDQ